MNGEENGGEMGIAYKKNLKMIKTDDRLYPNKINLPNDLKYSKERVFSEINSLNISYYLLLNTIFKDNNN